MTQLLVGAFVVLVIAGGAPSLAIAVGVVAVVLVVASKWP